MQNSFILFCVVLALPVACSPQKTGILTEGEAITRAEEFVKDNGYTDLPPRLHKSKLVPESVEVGLENRRNTLEPKAYGVIAGGSSGAGWYVVFRYNRNSSEYQRLSPDFEQSAGKYGRAVLMDRYGENLKVEHQDIGLESTNLKRIGPLTEATR